jgi:hypothetical protein
MLQPEEYPANWPRLPKSELLRYEAELMGLKDKVKTAEQTTRFHNGRNSVGVQMNPSSLTGQDLTGLNDGSKNSVLVTYLADAWNWGAEMFCECEVRHITKAPGRPGYIVYFAWHGNNSQIPGSDDSNLMWVHAKSAVFVGAGAIATTEILLRSRDRGLPMSEQVGERLSDNGDHIALA